MPPEEADSTEGTAKPRQLAEPEECPGGAKIKPPFEMGVSDFPSEKAPSPTSFKEMTSPVKKAFNPLFVPGSSVFSDSSAWEFLSDGVIFLFPVKTVRRKGTAMAAAILAANESIY